MLIGEQATGKSTVVKVLAVCRYFSFIIQNDLSKQPFENGLISWGLSEGIKDNTFIHYNCSHYSFTAERKENFFEEYDQHSGKVIRHPASIFVSELRANSEEFKNLLEELEKIKPTLFDELPASRDWTIPTSFFQNDVSKVMDNPFFLPVERGLQSIFSLGRSSIQNISDALFNQLAYIDRIARLFTSETLIEPLGIVYKNEQGRGYVRKNNENKFISLYNAASGYKSTIPAILVSKYYGEKRRKKKTLIIEEPELDLFPSAQHRLIQFTVEGVTGYGNTILLTTHSPYTLTSLNNFIYAYQVGKKRPAETEQIIDRKYWLDPTEVSAYMLKPDGTATDIFDREINQIDAGPIDQVSRSMNEAWDRLLKIEVNG